MTYRVVILRSAERDIRQIVDWWAEHRSAEQAERWYRGIYPAMLGLAYHPERCPVPGSGSAGNRGSRTLFDLGSHPTHRVLFTIVGDEVRIMRVRHTAQQQLTPEDLNSCNLNWMPNTSPS